MKWPSSKVDHSSNQRHKCERVSVCLSYQLTIISHSRAVLERASLSYFESRTQINYIDSLAAQRQVREGSKFITIRPGRWLALHLFLSLVGVCVFALAVTYAAQISIFHFSRCITNQSVRRPKLHLFIGTPSTLLVLGVTSKVHAAVHLWRAQVKSSQTNQAPVASPQTWSHWWILIRHGHVID